MQHGGAAKLGIGRKAGAIHFVQAAFVGIDLLAGRGKLLNGKFLDAFANPVEARGGTRIFKRENQEYAALRESGDPLCGRRGRGLAEGWTREKKKDTGKQNREALAGRWPPLFHLRIF